VSEVVGGGRNEEELWTTKAEQETLVGALRRRGNVDLKGKGGKMSTEEKALQVRLT
jgi:hypothetical protein